MRRAKRALAVMAFTLVSCSTAAVPASTPTSNTVALRIYATTAMLPLVNELTDQYTKLHPSVTFEIVSGNFQSMIDRLMSNQDGYLLTNHLPAETSETDFFAWPIGQEGIAVIVHPDNPVTGLTTDQLRRIYLGHVTSWNEVGGADWAIVVFSREDGSGTRAEFEQLVMGERLTRQSAQIAPSSAAMVQGVAETLYSIGYVSMGYLDSRVKALVVDDIGLTPDTVSQNRYPLRSTLFVVGLAEPEHEYRAFIGWIQSPEGQAQIGVHYAPLLSP